LRGAQGGIKYLVPEGMMRLYSGTERGWAIYEGQCWTDNLGAADTYARGTNTVGFVDLPSSLTVEDCDGYNRETNDAPADEEAFRAAAAARGVDVLRYSDEDEGGAQHDCYRLVSERAVEAVRAAAALVAWDDEDEVYRDEDGGELDLW